MDHSTGKSGIYFDLTVAANGLDESTTTTAGNTKVTDTPNKAVNVKATMGF